MSGKSILLVDFLFRYISPEYHAGAEYEINSSSRFCAVDDGRHFVMIQRYLPYVVLHGEQQGRVSFHGLASGVVLRVSQVSGFAFALERALFVDTYLRAAAFDFALVDICKTQKKKKKTPIGC